MRKTIKETVREALEVFGSNDSTINVEEIMKITGLTRRQVWGAIQKLDDSNMVKKIGNIGNRRYQYIGHSVENISVLETNQEGVFLPLIKIALSTMKINTAVHIGWKTHDGEVFCLCGSNEVARKRAKEDNFDPANWHEVSPEKYKNVTCKKCIAAWYANKTRTGDVHSAQDYVREKIRRDHIERTNRSDTSSSTPSDPIPLDDNMKDEPIKAPNSSKLFKEAAEKVDIVEEKSIKDGFEDGDIFNVQVKLVKMGQTPAGTHPASYKCKFCCFNGHRPCPRASLDLGEDRFLCYEAGLEYYFIEVLSKQG